MAEDVVHINLTDPNEQVYCHLLGEVSTFDGPFVSKTCWTCPYWTGLARGYGVECTYDDPNASSNPVKYSKATAAKAEAPEPPEDPETISSQAGVAALRSREQLPTSGEETEEEVSDEEIPTGEESSDAEPSADEEQPAEEVPAQGAEDKEKKPFPPKQKADYKTCPGCGKPVKDGKCSGCGSEPENCKCRMHKSVTVTDIISELSKVSKSSK